MNSASTFFHSHPSPRSATTADCMRSALAIRGVWRATDLARPSAAVVATGWSQLDRELPGGGWPSRSLTEILVPQPAVVEWRLLGPALRQVVAQGEPIVAIGPPHTPYLPGLQQEGLDGHRFVWVDARTPVEQLWVAEQLIKANACGAVIAWLPQAQARQIRRLQVCAQSCKGLVFLCRPDTAQHQSSAAPLRVHAGFGPDWELQLRILKRRGPPHGAPLVLPSVPGSLSSIITPRLLRPSQLFVPKVPANALGRPVTAAHTRWRSALQ